MARIMSLLNPSLAQWVLVKRQAAQSPLSKPLRMFHPNTMRLIYPDESRPQSRFTSVNEWRS